MAYRFKMKHLDKEKISELVKHGRAAKGLTQQELADAINISLRSVQRIENAEVLPRFYTLKLLAQYLDFSDELDAPLIKKEEQPIVKQPLNKARKLILTIGIALLLILLTAAFLAQSARFPETTFELFLLIAFLILIYAVVLWRIWR
jgi:transcriptional regulator with XRE-family HTH domain